MRKLLTFAAGFAAAALLSWYFVPETWLPYLAALGAALGFFGLLRRGDARLRAFLAAAGLAVGFFWCFGYDALVVRPAAAHAGYEGEVVLTARDYPAETENGRWLDALLRGEDGRACRVLVFLRGDGPEIRPGDTVTLTLRLYRAEGAYYAARGVFLRGYADGGCEVEPRAALPLRYLPAESAHLLKTGLEAVLGEDASALTEALVLGDRGALTDETESAFARSGLAHVMSVSGLHVCFLIWMLAFALGRHKRRTALICIPLAILFAGMAGFPPSASRAVVMNLCFLVAPLVGREGDGPTELSAAALLILLVNPCAAAGVGFQLSFAATAGILLVSAPIYGHVRPHLPKPRGSGLRPDLSRGAMNWLASTLALTLGAMLFATPLVALYFGYFSLVGILANLLLLWLFAATFALGLVTGAAAAVWLPLGRFLAAPTGVFAGALSWIVGKLGGLTFAALDLANAYYAAWLVLCYALLLVWIFWPRRAPRRRMPPVWPPLLCAACALALALALSWGAERYAALTVRVLDVGQGQSVALTSQGACAVVDCGGSAAENAGDTAADTLAGVGEGTVDLLLLTHFHSDHTNGVAELFARMDVVAVALPVGLENEAGDVLALAREEGSAVYWIDEITVFPLGEASLTVCPPLGGGDENERGLSVLCTAGDYDALITGDMGGEVERLLLERMDLPDIELLVVGHHGSRTSTTAELLEALKPETAVISVGADNSYGHPNGATLLRLAEAGCAVYRTDENGTVTIRTR
ncbi:MAG TPA: DNA internalization-related competence protein ComEC/Rec2 [Oscillospiraceae bacterium]|nr:DNA internalization-related competence protein ComEC/Rec2 [Oscillospiraceae bacterium]